jgi:hypothetical protein
MSRDSSPFEAGRLHVVRWRHAEYGGTIVNHEPGGIRKEAASVHSLFLSVSMETTDCALGMVGLAAESRSAQFQNESHTHYLCAHLLGPGVRPCVTF